MTKDERDQAIEHINDILTEATQHDDSVCYVTSEDAKWLRLAIKALERESINKSAMMCEIYMEGVNMSGEYQGCWVRFKDIEKIVDKYMGDKE